ARSVISRRPKPKSDTIDNLQHRLRNLFYFNPTASAISGSIQDVDLTGDRIVVHLAPAAYEKFTSLNSDELVRSTLSASLLVPALVLALEKIMRPEDREVLMDLRWCRTVIKKLKDIDIDVESLSEGGENSLVLSNKLIGDPLSAALEDLTQILLRAED
ncbi:hypothetical protein GSY71_18515, partial [Pusillimonas sp. TS35]|nr:hypothetical protein [Pusillimonas sp. TS35]